jgi:transposase-like protein
MTDNSKTPYKTDNSIKPVLMEAYLDDEPYCHNCGEDENLRYNGQYANGEYWTCKECGENFFYNRKEHCH